MLITADMQRRNPKKPVTKVPQRKTLMSAVPRSAMNLVRSPLNRMNGANRRAEPALVQYASWMLELLQCGRDILMKTAWREMNSDERNP
jgi:hypothetical protein